MSSSLKQAIFKTLIYSNIFDYPLTGAELRMWLIKIKNQESRIKNVISVLKNEKIVEEKEGCYFLKGGRRIVSLRQERKVFSSEKFTVARKIANILRCVPSIQLVGVTGALSMENAGRDDDIDFLIVSKTNWIWTTRCLATLLLDLIGVRRRPGEKNVQNKICLNMYLAENHLAVARKDRDLFSAHEVLQMKLLWDRNDVYKKFLEKNRWTKKYLPNAFPVFTYRKYGINKNRKNSFLENIMRGLQLRYMKKRRSTEKISDGILQFHPHDVHQKILREYTQKVKQYKLK